MGGVVGKAVGTVTNFLGGGGQTQVSGNAADPRLGNAGNLNWDLGSQIAQRNNQTYADFLAQQTAGMEPSIAQAQLKAATDQNIANQAAMAASARGGSAGTTQRLAAQQGAASGQLAAQQNAILAAQEAQQNAANALGYQGMNNQFAQALYSLGNQRDLGLMGGQIQGGLGAAGVEEQGKNRNRQGVTSFMNFLGGLGQGAATAGTSRMV